jgi:hypothetical protein
MGGISERHKEIQRRRHRRKKYNKIKLKLAKASVSEKAVLATKIRRLTVGAETVIDNFGLEER